MSGRVWRGLVIGHKHNPLFNPAASPHHHPHHSIMSLFLAYLLSPLLPSQESNTHSMTPPSSLHIVDYTPSAPLLPSLQSHYAKSLSTSNILSVTNTYFDAYVQLTSHSTTSITAATNSEPVEGLIVTYKPGDDEALIMKFMEEKFFENVQDFGEDDAEAPTPTITTADSPSSKKWGSELRMLVCLVSSEAEETAITSLSPISDNDDQEDASLKFAALMHSFEYCVARVDTDGIKLGHESREKEGFARIIEAVEMTMWGSKVDKVRETKSQPQEEETVAEAVQAVQSDTDKIDSLLPPPPPIEEALNSKNMDDLERLMSSVSQIREMSLNNGFANDDDRRKAASDTAAKLMGLLQLMEEGDGEEGGGEGFDEFAKYMENKLAKD